MHKNNFKHNQVSSVIRPPNRNDTKKRKLEAVNYETQNSSSLCTNNITHKIVNLSKENAMPSTDVMKLGE